MTRSPYLKINQNKKFNFLRPTIRGGNVGDKNSVADQTTPFDGSDSTNQVYYDSTKNRSIAASKFAIDYGQETDGGWDYLTGQLNSPATISSVFGNERNSITFSGPFWASSRHLSGPPIIRNPIMIMDSGAFVFSGAEVTLTYDPLDHLSLSAESGLVAFSGTDSTRKRGMKVAASGTSYSISGTNASLFNRKNLISSAAFFGLQGSDATLTITPSGGGGDPVAPTFGTPTVAAIMTGSATLTIDTPVVNDDDLLVAFGLSGVEAGRTMTPPAGWTNRYSLGPVALSPYETAYLYIWTKIANNEGASYNFTLGNSNTRAKLVIVPVVGVDDPDNVGSFRITSDYDTTSGTTITTSPTITAGSAESGILRFVCDGRQSQTFSWPLSTELMDNGTTFFSVSAAYSIHGAGDTGAEDITIGVPWHEQHRHITIAMLPSGVTPADTLISDPGSFSVVGTDVTLTYDSFERLVADSGTYTITGTPAALSYGFLTSPEVPAFPEPSLTATQVAVGGEIWLTTPGQTYTLTDDIVAEETAIVVAASDVTVDLNGYNIFYNEIASTYGSSTLAVHVDGIHCWTSSIYEQDQYLTNVPGGVAQHFNTIIRNGGIYQRTSSGKPAAVGGRRGNNATIQNMSMLHARGIDPSSVFFLFGASLIQDNICFAQNTDTFDRHAVPANIKCSGTVQRNLIIDGNAGVAVNDANTIVTGNIIANYMKVTNGYGFSAYNTSGCVVTNNLFIPRDGRGVLINSSGTPAVGNHIVDDNVFLTLNAPNAEFGQFLKATAFRARYHITGNQFTNNTVLGVAGGPYTGCAPVYLSNYNTITYPDDNIITGNILYAVCIDDQAPDVNLLAQCITFEGCDDTGRQQIQLDNNICVSNEYIISTHGYDGSGVITRPLLNNSLSFDTGTNMKTAFMAAVTAKLAEITVPTGQWYNYVISRYQSIMDEIDGQPIRANKETFFSAQYTGNEELNLSDTIGNAGLTLDDIHIESEIYNGTRIWRIGHDDGGFTPDAVFGRTTTTGPYTNLPLTT